MILHASGWCPDHPDRRDFLLSDWRDLGEISLPSHLDLREPALDLLLWQPNVLTHSVSNSILAMLNWQCRKYFGQFLNGSSKFLHDLTIRIHGGSELGGVSLRAALKTLRRFGTPPSRLCQSSSDEEMLNRPELYGYFEKYRSIEYYRLDGGEADRLTAMKTWLAMGNPFLLGTSLSIEMQISGFLVLNDTGTNPVGNTVGIAMGYDDNFGAWHRNGAGQSEAGRDGALLVWLSCLCDTDSSYIWLPYELVAEQCARDAWGVNCQFHSV